MPEHHVDICAELVADEADRAATRDHCRRLRGDDEPLSAPHNDVRRRGRRPGSVFRPAGGTGSVPTPINEAVYATETHDLTPTLTNPPPLKKETDHEPASENYEEAKRE